MSKSKCERELEEMTKERDHWRKKAHEHAAENAELRRQIERMQIHAGALGAGMVGHYERAIERLQIDRDRYATAIADACAAVMTDFPPIVEQFDKGQAELEER
jgi:ferric-dicitrate binding protein FerR (iron transport regulator)